MNDMSDTKMPIRALLPQDVAAQMITRIAQGLESPLAIAGEYGLSADEYDVLEQQSWFQQAVTARRDELKETGYHLRYKAGAMFEDMMEEVFDEARKPSASLKDRLDTLKYFGDVAGVKPKEETQTGTGFQINITIGEQPKPITVEGVPTSQYSNPAEDIDEIEIAEKVKEFTLSMPTFDGQFGYVTNNDLIDGFEEDGSDMGE